MLKVTAHVGAKSGLIGIRKWEFIRERSFKAFLGMGRSLSAKRSRGVFGSDWIDSGLDEVGICGLLQKVRVMLLGSCICNK